MSYATPKLLAFLISVASMCREAFQNNVVGAVAAGAIALFLVASVEWGGSSDFPKW